MYPETECRFASIENPLEIHCPFCPLYCSLAWSASETPITEGRLLNQGDRVFSESSSCALAAERWGRYRRAASAYSRRDSNRSIEPILMGQSVVGDALQWEESLSRLSRAKRVIVDGLIVDVQTARAAVRAAASFRGRLYHSNSDHEWSESLERNGLIGSTIHDVALHADTIVMLGPVNDTWPRLERRMAEIREANKLAPLGVRCIATAGELATLWANGRELSHEWLNEARSLAWFIAPGFLNRYQIGSLLDFNDRLNGTRRSRVVPMSQGTTLRTVASWLTGLTPPLDFSRGLPQSLEYEHDDFGQPDPVERADVCIWLRPYPDSPLPPPVAEFTIVVGCETPQVEQGIVATFRTSVPGIESSCLSYRGDGTVCVALGQIQGSTDGRCVGREVLAIDWPSAAYVLSRLTSESLARRLQP